MLDSAFSTKWEGVGFDIKSGQIIVLKNANFGQKIDIPKGEYVFKIVGKKRTGSGSIDIKILTDKNDVIFSETINFNSTHLTEYSSEISIPKNMGSGKIYIFRNKSVYGSVEIGRITISEVQSNKPAARESKDFRKITLNKATDAILNDFNSGSLIKIAFIVPYSIYGGAEVYIKNIICNLFSPKIHIHYLKDNKLRNNINQSNVEHIVHKNTESLGSTILSGDYDFVVFYNSLNIYNLLLGIKNIGLKSKIVEIYHSDFTWADSISSIKTRRNVDVIISVSENLANDIKGNFKKFDLPVGIDFTIFKSTDIEKINNSYDENIVTVARLSKEKDIDYILNLSKHMKKTKFTIIGDGPEEQRLKNRIEQEGITNVHLYGHSNDVYAQLGKFDGFLLTSLIEGTPISILEAMACGIPIFTTMVGSISDIVKDGETGFEIKKDPLYDSILIKKQILNFNVIESAQKYVKENHNSKVLSKKFIKILNNHNFSFSNRKNKNILKGEYV